MIGKEWISAIKSYLCRRETALVAERDSGSAGRTSRPRTGTTNLHGIMWDPVKDVGRDGAETVEGEETK